MRTIAATQLLRDDHKVIKGLIIQSETTESRAPEMRRGVILELCMLLEIHIHLEEEIFYPQLENYPEMSALVVVSMEDHERMRQLIQGLQQMEMTTEKFEDQLQELIAFTYFHFETEEQSLFPMAEKLSSSTSLESIGNQMVTRKTDLMKSPEYKNAQPAIVQDPNGGEQKRKPSAA